LLNKSKNPRPLWISPDQCTFCGKFTFRACIESVESIDFIAYTLRLYTIVPHIITKKSLRFQFFSQFTAGFMVLLNSGGYQHRRKSIPGDQIARKNDIITFYED